MKVLVLNGSPSGKDSITLFTVRFIEKSFPQCKFEVLHVGQKIKSIEKDFSASAQALRSADLILFCYPVYTFLVPSQLHRFIELIKEHGIDLKGKYASQISTSKHFYDVTAHRFIEDNCGDLGLRYIQGLSADMEDLRSGQGQREALDYFRFVLWNMERGFSTAGIPAESGENPEIVSGQQPSSERQPGKVVVVADLEEGSGSPLEKMIRHFTTELPMDSKIVNLRTFPFSGGCLGCFHCASDGTCIYKDGFDQYLREHIQSADAIVYAYTIRDHSMGYRFKLYDDRQFCNGHRTVTMGKPVAYLVEGCLDREENLRLLMEARAQVGGNYLAGVVDDSRPDTEKRIRQMAQTLSWTIARQFRQPRNFYGVGGLKIFRDLIYQMQGLMRADHKFYKANGFYDFPQKHQGRKLAMYLVGAMMSNKKLRSRMGGKMTEGMTLPYRKIIEK